MVRYITSTNSLMVITCSEAAKKRAEMMSDIYYRNLRRKLILLRKSDKTAAATRGAGVLVYIVDIVCRFLRPRLPCFPPLFVGEKDRIEKEDEGRPGLAPRTRAPGSSEPDYRPLTTTFLIAPDSCVHHYHQSIAGTKHQNFHLKMRAV